MLGWFEKRAPIRVKFKVLIALHGVLAGSAAVAACIAADRAGAPLLAGIAIAGAVAVVMVTFVAGRLICTPYVNTVLRMEALAGGDLASPIDYTDNLDCVGRMTKAMAIFRHNSAEADCAGQQRTMAAALGEGLGRLADGDLCYRIETPFPEGFEALRNDYNRAMGAMMAAIVSVSQAAGNVNTGAYDIGQASDDLSRRTEQQAASLEQTAAAMDQITATVRQTAEGALRADGAVQQARMEAEQSGEVVRRAVAAMTGIERASSEISEIISVIDGIAFQTNLLALNAGVEAARAGDAGRGFAVVAAEVRALAQRSETAAKDVKLRINASLEQVDLGVGLVGETGAALGRIIGRIGDISGLVSTIATAAQQQATGLQQVNIAVTEMDGVTQQNAALVEESNAAARSLSDQADAMTQHISCFKIDRRMADRGMPVADDVPRLRAVASNPARETQPAARSGAARVRAVGGGDWSAF